MELVEPGTARRPPRRTGSAAGSPRCTRRARPRSARRRRTARRSAWIGLAPMRNETGPDWPDWYAAHRVAAVPAHGRRPGCARRRRRRAVESVCERIVELAGPAEPPARLHGDLWSGNVLWGADGRVWLIDPAAHGGHRETDLAMLHLFGCPHLDRIVAAYDEAAPLADGWRGAGRAAPAVPAAGAHGAVRRRVRRPGRGGRPVGAAADEPGLPLTGAVAVLAPPGMAGADAGGAGLRRRLLRACSRRGSSTGTPSGGDQRRDHAGRSPRPAARREAAADGPSPRGNEWRTVTADRQLPRRRRGRRAAADGAQGEPAFEVLTPFRLADGTVVARRPRVRPAGAGPPGADAAVYAAPPAGTVTLTARVRADERDPAPPGRAGGLAAAGVRGRLAAPSRAQTGLAIRPGYVQLADGSPGVLGALPLPELEAGPFLSYALQWITFGVMALLGGCTSRGARCGPVACWPRRAVPPLAGRATGPASDRRGVVGRAADRRGRGARAGR